jgi:hypothetical protein
VGGGDNKTRELRLSHYCEITLQPSLVSSNHPNHLSLAQVYHVTVTVNNCVNRMAGGLEGNTLQESMLTVEDC